jgi:hypothetical protein
MAPKLKKPAKRRDRTEQQPLVPDDASTLHRLLRAPLSKPATAR